MKRPCVLFTTHSPFVSGAEYVLLTLTEDWRGAKAFLFEDGPLSQALLNNDIHVVVSQRGRGLNTFKRDGSLLKAVPIAFRLSRTVFEMAKVARSCDLVYANSQKAFTIAAIAKLLYRRPLIWHLHDILDASHFGASQVRMQVQLANAFANKVVVPSDAARESFITQGGREELVQVVPNGIADHPPDLNCKSELRSQLGLPSGPLVGVFSRLAPWKGQREAILALAQLPDVQCIIVGSALFGEDDYHASLTSLVMELGMGHRVRFLGQRSDVRRLMQAVDLVIHPSLAPEPFGLTIVEAMSVKTPVLATAIGASTEILANGAAGWLVPPRDPDAIAKAVAGALGTDSDLATITGTAFGLYNQRYRADSMRWAVNKIIHDVA